MVKEAKLKDSGRAYHAKLRLVFEENEALYGLGQNEEGYGNLRGKTVYGHQANRKTTLPLFVSTKGYGILTDTYSPYIFNDTGMETYIYTEADPEMDFYFMMSDTSGTGRGIMIILRRIWDIVNCLFVGISGEAFYDALVSSNKLRYELMPYIYSLVGRVWLEDASMMRFLAFDYPQDKVACNITSQYMFGDSLMVCPVTKPMYYEADSLMRMELMKFVS